MHFITRARLGLGLRRGHGVYGAVVLGGLLFGFNIPRPSWVRTEPGGKSLGEAAPTPDDLTDELSPPTVDLEPVAAALDGAESPELHALRSAEKRISSAQQKSGSATPDHDVCGDDGSMCRDELSAGWMSGLRMPDLPVRGDAKIARFLHYFVDDPQGRKIFRSWLRRSGRYRGAVELALRERVLPRDLVALVFVESGFSPQAVSSAGAVGLWQFMPETARAYGLSVEADFDERRSVARASDAGARHLSDLYEKFGSWELALAAYDMGYKGMLDRVRDSGSNDYWTLSKLDGALPKEALLYVPKVLAVAILLNNLERFGFQDTRVDPPIATANLEVPAGVDLALVARATGTSIQRLRELNPELLSDSIPDRGRTFVAHVPTSGLARAHAMLPRLLDRRARDGLEHEVGRGFDWGKDEMPQGSDFLDAPREKRSTRRGWPLDDTGDAGRTVFYRVGEHETLDDVARMFGVTREEIIEANYLDPSARLQKGMLLSLAVRGDVMSRIAKRRAAARLERQDEEEGRRPPGDLDRADGDVMNGYALATPPHPDVAKRPRPVHLGAAGDHAGGDGKRAPIPREGK
jgi:membrane-bound lytic murein transglycosylase D